MNSKSTVKLSGFPLLIYNFLFSENGRLSRGGFTIGLILKTIAIIFLGSKINELENTFIESLIFFCMAIPVYWSYAALVTRRCYDFDEDTKKFGVQMRYGIPLIGSLIMFDELLFRPGNQGANNYGEKPEF